MLEHVGSVKKYVQVFCSIKYEPSPDELKESQTYRHIIGKYKGTGRLSITGVVGPRSNGDAYGSCGQISDTIREAINAGEFKPNDAQGWTVPDVLSFLDLWDRYHLNDMRPECEHQRAAGWPQMARTILDTGKARGWTTYSDDPRGLLGKPCEVCGYKYGHAWNTEKLPVNLLHTLEALAESKNIPAWI